MEKITLPSGALLDITLLPYEEAWHVSQQIAKVIEPIKLDIKGIDLARIGAEDIMRFQGPLMQVLASKDVITAAKICFKRCTYNGLKIDDMTFNPAEARKDYLFVVVHVLRENIAPFFAGLSLSSGTK